MRFSLTTNKVLTPVLALVLFIFIAVLFLLIRETSRTKTNASLVGHTHEVLFQSTKVLASITDNETGSRGFALTGKEEFLEPVAQSGTAIQNEIKALYQLTKTNAIQQKRIDSVLFYANKRIAFSSIILQVRKEKGLNEAVKLVTSGEGKWYTDNIRRILATIESDENVLLKERKLATEKADKVQNGILFIMIVISMALIIIFLRKDQLHIAAQKKAEQHFKLLTNTLNEYAIFMLDPNGIILSWSTSATHIKGYTEKEIVGQPVEIFYTAEDRKGGEPARNIAMAKQFGHYQMEGLRVRKDGSTFWADVVFTALRDEGGVLYGYSNITRDITERKKAQQELEFMSLQINQSYDAIYVVDAERKIKNWNSGAEKLYGFTKEEALDKEPNRLLSTDMTEEDLNNAIKDIEQNDYWIGEVKRKTKAGHTVYIQASTTVIRDANRTITGYISVGIDISSRKQLQRQINHLANIVEKSSEAIFSIGPDLGIISWNDGAEKLYGYNKEQAIGKTPVELELIRRPDVEISSMLQELFEGGSLQTELDFYTKDGSGFFGALSANPIRNEQGKITSLFFIVKDISLRRQLEEQLKKNNEVLEEKVRIRTEEIESSEKRYRYLFENNPMPMWVIDLESFKFLDVNKMAVLQYGYSRDEFLAMSATDIRPDEDKDIFIKSDHAFTTDASNYNRGEWRHKKKDGTIIAVEIFAHEIIFEGQRARFILSNDITEKKKAEAALKSSEEHYRMLIDQSAEGILVSDKSGRFTAVNNAASNITGYAREEILQMDIADLLAPEERQRIPEEIARVAGSKVAASEWIFKRKDQSVYIGEITIRELPDGRLQSVLRDITQRRAAQEALSRSEKLYRSLFENMMHGFTYCKAIYIDGVLKDYIYLAVNNEYENVLNLKNIVGKKVSEVAPGLFESDPLYAEVVGRVLQSGIPEKFESYAAPLHKWIAVSIYSPEKGYFVGLVDNITERKNAEERTKQINVELEERVIKRTDQLRKTNDELEAFSYSVSHDLRAPLRAIIGFTAILEEDYSSQLDAEAKRITGIIKHNTTKMGNLIDDLLSFSRMGRQDVIKTHINFTSLVNEVVGSIDNKENNNKHIKWRIHKLPSVKADINTMRQVWINLVSNAVKYSAKTAEPVIEIGSFNKNGQVIFYVKDNGIGFDEKYKNKLFKVFQRLHGPDEFEGTGIGLAIVEKVISKHGGEVWAEATLNEGATFYFSLPENEPVEV